MSLSCDLVSVHGPNKSIYLINSICCIGFMFCFPSVDHVMILGNVFFVCFHYLCIYLHMNERKLKEMVVHH